MYNNDELNKFNEDAINALKMLDQMLSYANTLIDTIDRAMEITNGVGALWDDGDPSCTKTMSTYKFINRLSDENSKLGLSILKINKKYYNVDKENK